MRLKGKARLIIRDASSGKIIHDEEHSNTITPALQKIFNNNISGTVDYTKLTPILDKLIGGVCLWDGTLDENSIFLPKQTRATLTAHAGQNTYSSAASDPTRGNPDTEDESYGPTENGFVFVWTFDRSQGVGDITGLTLCHADVGDYYSQIDLQTMPDFEPVEDISNYITNSNDITYSDASPSAASLPQVVGYNKLDKIPLGFYGDTNRVVSIEFEETSAGGGYGGGEWRSGQVNIYISKFTGNGLWLWNNLGELIPEEEKTLHITLPNWQWANFGRIGRCIYDVAYDESNKHIYFLSIGERSYYDWEEMPSTDFNYSWLPFSHTLHITDINLETGDKETREANLIFEDGNSLVFRAHEEQYQPRQLHIIGGCVYLPAYICEWKTVQRWNPLTQEFYNVRYPDYEHIPTTSFCGACVNLRTGAIEERYITGPFATEGDNARSYTASLDLGNERAMGPDIITERNSERLYNKSVPRNTQLFGSNWRSNRLYVASRSSSLIQYGMLYRGAGSGDRIRGAILNKMYQASVFRLSQKVTKRNDQTMTVIYTIEQEEEEES